MNLINKIGLCLLAILVSAVPLLKLNSALLPVFWSKNLFIYSGSVLVIILIIVSIKWIFLKNKSKIDDKKMVVFFESVIVYFVTFGFTKWALLKFCHLHMTTSLAWMEMPQTMLSGYQKVSHFYGQNYPLVMALGIIELTGAIFMLFRKTRLLGAFILTGSCINILLIDVFFKIPSPILEAVILLVGTSYFLYLEREKLINLFFRNNSNSDNKMLSIYAKWILKLSAIIIPCIIFIPNFQKQYKPSITGKYLITKIVNSDESDESELSKELSSKYDYVYFDLGNYFSLVSSDFEKRQVGHLKIDEKTRKFKVEWIYPKNLRTNLVGQISDLNQDNHMTLSGSMGEEKIQIELQKEEVKSIWMTY